MINTNIQLIKEEDAKKIHNGSLELLQNVGLKLNDIEILKKLKKFDTAVDIGSKTLKIPKNISNFFFVSKKLLYNICNVF